MTDPTSTEAAPETELAFRLPAALADDPELVEMHREWVNKLRAESAGLPMHTVQEFLLERIATGYVMLRHREIHTPDLLEVDDPVVRTRLRVTAERNDKDATDQWLSMVKEWNKVLSSGHEQLREQVLRESEQIALDALSLVEDKDTRQKLRLHFKERYAAIGY